MKTAKWIALFIVVSFIAACASQPVKPPEGAMTWNVNFPAKGTVLVYDAIKKGKPEVDVFTFKGKTTYDGKPAYLYTVSNGKKATDNYADMNGNLIARVRDGKVLLRFHPSSQELAFPMWVGQRRNIFFNVDGTDVRATFRVLRTGKFTLNGKVYEVLRIKGGNDYYTLEKDYCPELGYNTWWKFESQDGNSTGTLKEVRLP